MFLRFLIINCLMLAVMNFSYASDLQEENRLSLAYRGKIYTLKNGWLVDRQGKNLLGYSIQSGCRQNRYNNNLEAVFVPKYPDQRLEELSLDEHKTLIARYSEGRVLRHYRLQ